MNIVLHPDPILAQDAKPVERFDDDLRSIVDKMLDVMYSSDGVGLAAPQVGLGLDLFLVDPTGGNSRDGLIVMVNPKLSFPRPETVKMNEGCLSVPGVFLPVVRPAVVEVLYQDLRGQTISSTFDGWSSRIIQHEHDHLRGIMMMDRVVPAAPVAAVRNRAAGRR